MEEKINFKRVPTLILVGRAFGTRVATLQYLIIPNVTTPNFQKENFYFGCSHFLRVSQKRFNMKTPRYRFLYF